MRTTTIEEMKPAPTTSIIKKPSSRQFAVEQFPLQPPADPTDEEKLQTEIIKLRKRAYNTLEPKLATSKEALHYAIKVSVHHLLKECVEVIAWMATKTAKGPIPSIIYYEEFQECFILAAQIIGKYDPDFLASSSFYSLKLSTKDKIRIYSFSTKKEVEEKKDWSNDTKLYIPFSYGFKPHDAHILLNLIDEFKQKGILAKNIIVYLGPHEAAENTLVKNQAVRKIEINKWFMENQSTLREYQMKVLVHHREDIDEGYHDLIAGTLYDSQVYQKAESALIKFLLNEEGSKFKSALKAEVVKYLEPKFPQKPKPRNTFFETLYYDRPTLLKSFTDLNSPGAPDLPEDVNKLDAEYYSPFMDAHDKWIGRISQKPEKHKYDLETEAYKVIGALRNATFDFDLKILRLETMYRVIEVSRVYRDLTFIGVHPVIQRILANIREVAYSAWKRNAEGARDREEFNEKLDFAKKCDVFTKFRTTKFPLHIIPFFTPATLSKMKGRDRSTFFKSHPPVALRPASPEVPLGWGLDPAELASSESSLGLVRRSR